MTEWEKMRETKNRQLQVCRIMLSHITHGAIFAHISRFLNIHHKIIEYASPDVECTSQDIEH